MERKKINKIIILCVIVLCFSICASIFIVFKVNGEINANEKSETPQVLSALKNIKGCSFEAEVDSPKETAFRYKGIKVTGESGERCSFQYNGVYNLNDRNDFIRFLILPEINNQNELTYFAITLTDVYDQNRYLKMTFKDGERFNERMSSYITFTNSGKFNGYGNGYGYGSDGTISTSGTPNPTSFRGLVKNNDTNMWMESNFYYDVERKTIRFRKLEWNYSYTWTNEMDYVGFDFSDPRLGLDVFEGFTTNEVTITVEMESYPTKNSHVLLTKIAGLDLSGNIIENDRLQISVDYNGYDENILPYGVASENSSYPIFDAFAYSALDGICEVNDVGVYYGGQRISIKNGRFKTTKSGVYQIMYKATSLSGKVATKTISINVKDSYDKECAYEINEEIPSSVNFGSGKIYLYDGIASGGTGHLEVDTKLYLNNELYPLEHNGLIYYFEPKYSPNTLSIYKLVYELSDITGKKSTFEKEICVNYPTVPVFEDVTIPSYIRVGYETEFAIPKAYTLGSNGKKNYVDTSMTINGKVCNGKFTPTEAGVYYIEFSAGISTSKYSVEALAQPTEDDENNWYFKPSNFKFGGADSKSIYFTKGEGLATLEYANALSANDFSLSFDVEKNKISEIIVTLIDVVNPNQRLDFIVSYDEVGSYIQASGKKIGYISGSFTEESSKYLVFNYNDSLVFSNGEIIGSVEKYYNGEKFEGFGSCGVYAKITVKGDNNAKFYISVLNGHAFSQDVSDYRKPNVSFGSPKASVRSVNKNEKFTVYKAKGWDVFSGIKSIQVTVVSPNNETIYDGDADRDLEFDASILGRYSITYVATDTCGWREKIFHSVDVVDTIAPIVEGKLDLKANYNLGTSVSLPKIKASDDSGNVRTYYCVIIPTGEWKVLKSNTYVFEDKGVYRIRAVAIDGSMNTSYIEVSVRVS